jgi:hypothetical protein
VCVCLCVVGLCVSKCMRLCTFAGIHSFFRMHSQKENFLVEFFFMKNKQETRIRPLFRRINKSVLFPVYPNCRCYLQFRFSERTFANHIFLSVFSFHLVKKLPNSYLP